MSLKDTVEKHLEEITKDSPYFLVKTVISDHKSNRSISIYLDSDTGITIEECSQISRSLGKYLDEEIEESYNLIVSSPGADAPLILERQYKKNIGRNLKITKHDQTSIIGKLKEVENGVILIETVKKKITEETTLELEEIKEAKVVISFK